MTEQTATPSETRSDSQSDTGMGRGGWARRFTEYCGGSQLYRIETYGVHVMMFNNLRAFFFFKPTSASVWSQTNPEVVLFVV